MVQRIYPADLPAFSLYSPAVRVGNLIFLAGQLPINAEGDVEGVGDVVGQTRQVLENIRLVLAAAGASLRDVVKTTVFLVDMRHFAQMNEVYGQYFADALPARTTVQVAALAEARCLIEIDAVAARPQKRARRSS